MVEQIRNGKKHRHTSGWSGKYVELHDAYLSVAEALRHARLMPSDAVVDIEWIDSETLTADNSEQELGGAGRHPRSRRVRRPWDRRHAPGGEVLRGNTEMPYFGICLGMQIAVIEYARHVAGLPDADSGEFDPANVPHKVIDFMPGQSDEIDKGGTLRLGAYPCVIQPGYDDGHAATAALLIQRTAPAPVRIQQ